MQVLLLLETVNDYSFSLSFSLKCSSFRLFLSVFIWIFAHKNGLNVFEYTKSLENDWNKKWMSDTRVSFAMRTMFYYLRVQIFFSFRFLFHSIQSPIGLCATFNCFAKFQNKHAIFFSSVATNAVVLFILCVPLSLCYVSTMNVAFRNLSNLS